MSASRKEGVSNKAEASSSSPPADTTPKLNEKWAIQALVEQLEVALGRKPVLVTQIDRKTGKIVTFERFERNGLVAARCLELVARTLQLFDGRLRYEDEKSSLHMNKEQLVAYGRIQG